MRAPASSCGRRTSSATWSSSRGCSCSSRRRSAQRSHAARRRSRPHVSTAERVSARTARAFMLFPTVEFALFFPVVLALSWLLMARQALWKPFIVVASYVFYGYASWKFCLLLGAVTVGNQAAAVLIARTERFRSAILAVAVALYLGVLAVFKYYGFFFEDVDRALGPLSLSLPLLTIALPVGVSFFTFQAISYVVVVKRRLVEPASMIDVAIYLSFFPHLVAGPIVRARESLPQLAEPRDPRRVAVGSGLALIALGLVKKLAIADT